MLCSMSRFSAPGAAMNVLDFASLYEYVMQSRERFLATFRGTWVARGYEESGGHVGFDARDLHPHA